MSWLVGSQDPLLWYVNRSTGLVLLALLTLTVALGVAAGRRSPGGPLAGPRALPRFVPQAVHRSLGLLTVLLLAVHASSAVVDEYVDIRWWHALVPVGLRYQPAWLGIGVVASDVLLAVVLTSLVRGRLGHRHWRAVHLTAYGAWAASLLHGLTIGTDTGSTPVTWLYGGSGALVVVVVLARVVAAARSRAAEHGSPHRSRSAAADLPLLARRSR